MVKRKQLFIRKHNRGNKQITPVIREIDLLLSTFVWIDIISKLIFNSVYVIQSIKVEINKVICSIEWQLVSVGHLAYVGSLISTKRKGREKQISTFATNLQRSITRVYKTPSFFFPGNSQKVGTVSVCYSMLFVLQIRLVLLCLGKNCQFSPQLFYSSLFALKASLPYSQFSLKSKNFIVNDFHKVSLFVESLCVMRNFQCEL